jgi:hypothetical protein
MLDHDQRELMGQSARRTLAECAAYGLSAGRGQRTCNLIPPSQSRGVKKEKGRGDDVGWRMSTVSCRASTFSRENSCHVLA